MYTTDWLSDRFRSDVVDPLVGTDDGVTPDSESLWKIADVFDYMTHAADAVARGTLQLYKTVVLPVVAGENQITMPASVLYAQGDGWLVTGRRYVRESNAQELLRGIPVCDYGQWISGGGLEATGTPARYARDMRRKSIVLAPTPTENDSLRIECVVTVATPMLCGMPLPFTELPDILLMLKYMKYMAYRKQDADTLDLGRSDDFKAEFDRDVVLREVEIRRQRRAPSSIRMEW